MFKRKMLSLVLVALIAASLACSSVTINPGGRTVRGSGILQTEQRSVSGFEKIVLDGVGTVIVTIGDSETLEIEAEDNLLPLIESEVKGNTLHLGIKDGVGGFQPTKGITFRVTAKNLTAVTTAGAGNIELGDLQTSDLDITVSGAGNIETGRLEVDLLAVLIAGAGNFKTAGGQAERVKLEITGAGAFQAPDLQATRVDVVISGMGSARLWAVDLLDVMLTGMGSVEYYGQPALSQRITGLGTVKSLGDHP
jgi:hypothetical protein